MVLQLKNQNSPIVLVLLLVLICVLQIQSNSLAIAEQPRSESGRITESSRIRNADADIDEDSNDDDESNCYEHLNSKDENSKDGLVERTQREKQMAASSSHESTLSETNNSSTLSRIEQNAPAPQKQKYIGNAFSLKFHRPACPFAQVMRKSRRVSFPYRKAAFDAGHRPCKFCLPPWWLKVEAKLLNPALRAESEKQTPGPDE